MKIIQTALSPNLIKFLDLHELRDAEKSDHKYVSTLIENYYENFEDEMVDDELAMELAKQYESL